MDVLIQNLCGFNISKYKKINTDFLFYKPIRLHCLESLRMNCENENPQEKIELQIQKQNKKYLPSSLNKKPSRETTTQSPRHHRPPPI